MNMLNEIRKDGEILVLMDGSQWFINPYDMSIGCTWIPTAEIKIERTDNDMFNYKLTNLVNDTCVKAKKLK